MEPLTWAGSFGTFLTPLMLAAVVIFVVGFLANFVVTLMGIHAGEMEVGPDGTLGITYTPPTTRWRQ